MRELLDWERVWRRRERLKANRSDCWDATKWGSQQQSTPLLNEKKEKKQPKVKGGKKRLLPREASSPRPSIIVSYTYYYPLIYPKTFQQIYIRVIQQVFNVTLCAPSIYMRFWSNPHCGVIIWFFSFWWWYIFFFYFLRLACISNQNYIFCSEENFYKKSDPATTTKSSYI